ncbi:MAG: hypothetical protein ABI638_14880 [Ignavibacteriota bacterium]
MTKKIEAEIKHLIDNYWDSYLNGDLENSASKLLIEVEPDDDVTFVVIKVK